MITAAAGSTKRLFLQIPRVDLLVATGFAVVTAVAALMLHSLLLFTDDYRVDIWFDSDSLFVLDQLTDRDSPHNNTNSRHPLFPLLTYPVVKILNLGAGLSEPQAVMVVLLASSVLCVVAMYAALRLMRRPVSIASLFTAIFMVSSAGLLFLGIHERFVAGCLSILLCIVAFQLYERGAIPLWPLVIAAAGTLGITITNFMVGIAAMLLALGLKQGIQATVNSAFIVMVLSMLTTAIFPASTALLDLRTYPYDFTSFEPDPERQEKSGNLRQKAVAFWSHSVVLPPVGIEQKPKSAPNSHTRYLSVQRVGLGAHHLSGLLATAAWLGLLAVGLVKSIRAREKVDLLLGATLAGQAFLFMIFGSEAVLYSMYYVPLLLLLASKSWSGDGRETKLAWAASAFLALLAWNNLPMLTHAARTARLLL